MRIVQPPYHVRIVPQSAGAPNLWRCVIEQQESREVDVLHQAAKNRIAQLLPVKFKLMSESPFVFFRGSVEIMAADLGRAAHTGIEVQMCGDAHVKNFGFFASPGAEIALDINDFDETQ